LDEQDIGAVVFLEECFSSYTVLNLNDEKKFSFGLLLLASMACMVQSAPPPSSTAKPIDRESMIPPEQVKIHHEMDGILPNR